MREVLLVEDEVSEVSHGLSEGQLMNCEVQKFVVDGIPGVFPLHIFLLGSCYSKFGVNFVRDLFWDVTGIDDWFFASFDLA